MQWLKCFTTFTSQMTKQNFLPRNQCLLACLYPGGRKQATQAKSVFFYIEQTSWAVLKAEYWFVPRLKVMRWCKWKCVKSQYWFFLKHGCPLGNTARHTAMLVSEWNKTLFHKATHVQASDFLLFLKSNGHDTWHGCCRQHLLWENRLAKDKTNQILKERKCKELN